MRVLRNLVVISDLHCGCWMGLLPKNGIKLDRGPRIKPSAMQRKVIRWWEEFWLHWVPEVTHGEPYGICVNGDLMDGRKHGVTQISRNLADQLRIAYEVLAPMRDHPNCVAFFIVRGTEAHSGESSEAEEMLAERLDAMPDEVGNRSRYVLWIRIGEGLVNAMHHIGTTSSAAYETSAINAELASTYTDAGRWKNEPPDIVIRSHRHRSAGIWLPSEKGMAQSMVTAGWQLKTPFAYRIAGGRVVTPQIGGHIVRHGDEELHLRHKVWPVGRPKEEVVHVKG